LADVHGAQPGALALGKIAIHLVERFATEQGTQLRNWATSIYRFNDYGNELAGI
jgi:hypothetical protein